MTLSNQEASKCESVLGGRRTNIQHDGVFHCPPGSLQKNLGFKFRLAGQITQSAHTHGSWGKMWRSSPARQTQVSWDSEFVTEKRHSGF